MRTFVAFAALALAAPASAEVVSVGANGLVVRNSAQFVVPPAAVFAAFGRVGEWWSKDHTYSGDAANLRLSLQPGGCFCERIPDGGGVEHMRVTYVEPDKHIVLTGALGPLLYEAVAGVMDVTITPIAGGSRLTMEYRAAGFARGNAAALAPVVDQVLAEQVRRLRAFAPTGARRTEPIP